jgi:recombination protein RecR
MLPDRLLRVVQLLSRLPGVGEKTAQRYALALVSGDETTARELGRELGELHEHVRPCAICGHIAEWKTGESEGRCNICRDNRRDPTLLCVVARVQDLLAIEKSGSMRGRYHVLRRLLSPLEGVTRDDIGLETLERRVREADPPITEVVIATPPSVDGEATALLLARELGNIRRTGTNGAAANGNAAEGESPPALHVTRLASGVPHGGDLEFADQVTLGRAIEHRRRFA